jgi:hypothetical protein
LPSGQGDPIFPQQEISSYGTAVMPLGTGLSHI